MNKYKNIKKFLELFCPLNLILSGDFVGEQIGCNNKEIKKILIALDCTWEIIKKAKKENFDLIITHHPFLYPEPKIALENKEKKDKYNFLKENQIEVFCLHTNYDELFLKHILLNKFKIIEKFDFKNKLCIKGILKNSKKLKDFFSEIKKIFNIKSFDYFGNENKEIKSILISPGSGGSNLKNCYENNIDLLITGELKWNYWLEAKEKKQSVITVGHQMEEEFTNQMYDVFKKYNVKNNLNIFIEKIIFGPIKKNSND